MITFLPNFLGFKIINDVLSIFNLTNNLARKHRRCAIDRQYEQCNIVSMFICQHVHFGGEKEREKMREREGWTNRVKTFEQE